jgi:methyl-accepting chemotaxis protein
MTGHISEAVDSQKKETDYITTISNQTANNTQVVSINITKMSSAATHTKDLAGQVHSFSDDIALQLSDLLEKTTRQVTLLSSQSPQQL